MVGDTAANARRKRAARLRSASLRRTRAACDGHCQIIQDRALRPVIAVAAVGEILQGPLHRLHFADLEREIVCMHAQVMPDTTKRNSRWMAEAVWENDAVTARSSCESGHRLPLPTMGRSTPLQAAGALVLDLPTVSRRKFAPTGTSPHESIPCAFIRCLCLTARPAAMPPRPLSRIAI